MGDRRNLARVLAAAPELARRLRETEVTLGALRKEYHAAWPTMLRALLTQMDFAEYRRLARLRNARGGRKTRFPKGHIPWAAGKKLGQRPGCEPTQFKTGQLRGMAARNWRPVGTILIRFDRPPRRTRGRKNGRARLAGGSRSPKRARGIGDGSPGPGTSGSSDSARSRRVC